MTYHHCAGNHTAFMYIEDDDLLLWEAMLAWAQDEAPLAELGFMRAFARTETSKYTGWRGFNLGFWNPLSFPLLSPLPRNGISSSLVRCNTGWSIYLCLCR